MGNEGGCTSAELNPGGHLKFGGHGRSQALFRALKTKHETPKYGLIYHASLIGQAAPKNKGKMSRILAAKAALATRVDAMGSSDDATIGLESRAKVRTPHAGL